MHILQKLIDRIFDRFPSLKEFCFLALPLSHSNDARTCHYNAEVWNEYLERNPNALVGIIPFLDRQSIRLAKRLLKRRHSTRYFLTPTEVLRYYKAKHLNVAYWFPNNGTLLNSVFLTRAGICYLPTKALFNIKNRIAIDGGAASGDSSIVLLESGATKVISFEPSPLQRDEMIAVFAENKLAERVDIVPFAIGEHRQPITFMDQYGKTFTAESISIDEYCKDMDIGCIKLDIEGAEFPALRGAEKTIARCKPILLVCVYHRPEDLFEMPLWLHEKFPFYQFRIRDTEYGNTYVGAHLVILAWPDTTNKELAQS